MGKLGSFDKELKVVLVHETWLQTIGGARVYRFNPKIEFQSAILHNNRETYTYKLLKGDITPYTASWDTMINTRPTGLYSC